MVGRKAVLTRTLAVTAVLLALSACGRGNEDLRTYIDAVKARPGGRIEPLPPVHPAPSFAPPQPLKADTTANAASVRIKVALRTNIYFSSLPGSSR